MYVMRDSRLMLQRCCIDVRWDVRLTRDVSAVSRSYRSRRCIAIVSSEIHEFVRAGEIVL